MLQSGDARQIALALYAAIRYDEDSEWVQNQCLERLGSEFEAVRWAAATCLGDLAMMKRPIDKSRVVEALTRAATDRAIQDPARFSLGLIRQFAK